MHNSIIDSLIRETGRDSPESPDCSRHHLSVRASRCFSTWDPPLSTPDYYPSSRPGRGGKVEQLKSTVRGCIHTEILYSVSLCADLAAQFLSLFRQRRTEETTYSQPRPPLRPSPPTFPLLAANLSDLGKHGYRASGTVLFFSFKEGGCGCAS